MGPGHLLALVGLRTTDTPHPKGLRPSGPLRFGELRFPGVSKSRPWASKFPKGGRQGLGIPLGFPVGSPTESPR